MGRRADAQTVDGLVVVDKPAGWTSHDVVAKLRGVYGQRRIGHAGTLDPDATGVLLVGLGRATRLLRFLQEAGKAYEGVVAFGVAGDVVLGTETSTLDASGDVVATHDMNSVITRLGESDGVDFVQSVIDAHFVGLIDQVPPMVSAIRVDGKRLHELARERIEVEREARSVTVSRFVVTAISGNVISIDVTCSSGTFIRTLAADLGRALGGGAHLRNLRRTSVGAFTIADAAGIDDAPLRSVATAARGLSTLVVSGEEAESMRGLAATGKVLPIDRFSATGPEPWAVVAGDDVLAIYEAFSNAKVGEGMARPVVSLSSTSTNP